MNTLAIDSAQNFPAVFRGTTYETRLALLEDVSCQIKSSAGWNPHAMFLAIQCPVCSETSQWGSKEEVAVKEHYCDCGKQLIKWENES
mgnify:CR=1 FL=1